MILDRLFSKKKKLELNELQTKLLNHFRNFSGLEENYIKNHLFRKKGFCYKDEYNFRKPKKQSEVDWYYRTSEKYIFVNFIHQNWKFIDKISSGRILDYGAGSGIDTFYLAKKEGFQVDYCDIGIVQEEFVRFVIEEEKLSNVSIIRPYFGHKFNPIDCIQKEYDGVLFRSLLEHVPYYDELLEHVAKKVKIGGRIYEASQFGHSKKDPMHYEEKKPVKEILTAHGFELEFSSPPHNIWIKK